MVKRVKIIVKIFTFNSKTLDNRSNDVVVLRERINYEQIPEYYGKHYRS